MQGWLASGVVFLAVVAAGCSAADVDETSRDQAGTVTSGGTLGVERLQVGDCVDLGEAAGQESGLVEAFEAVPCGTPHEGEVYLVNKTFFTGDDDAFPGDDAIADQGDAECGPAFEEFIDEQYESTTKDFATISPTEDTWAVGDRSLLCLAYQPTADGKGAEKVTGTLKG
jgi:hypothetical protein